MDKNDKIDLLERLASLREAGALTFTEFETEKRKILSSDRGESSAFNPSPEIGLESNLAIEGLHSETNSTGSRIGIIACFVGFAGCALASLYLWDRAHTGPMTSAEVQVKASSGPSGQDSKKPDLSKVLRFSDPSNCDFFKSLEDRFFIPMWQKSSVQVEKLGAIGVSKRGPDSDGLVTYSLPIAGEWHGLNISRLVWQGWLESDSALYEIRFFDSPESVVSTLNGLGFALTKVGEEEVLPIPDGDLYTECYRGVHSTPGGAILRFGYQ